MDRVLAAWAYWSLTVVSAASKYPRLEAEAPQIAGQTHLGRRIRKRSGG